METFNSQIESAAADWAAATGICTAVFGFLDRALLDNRQDRFCARDCPLAKDGQCDPQMAHRFGCYEAERWEGQFIYYCPASLIFVATLTYERGMPTYGVVAGPIVMGPVEDLFGDLSPELFGLLPTVPGRGPAEVGSLARMQQTVCESLSVRTPEPAEQSVDLGLLEPAEPVPDGHDYPFEVEKLLVAMIRRADRAGAAELINRLLAVLYLANDGDFPRLRQGATELVTLFSRAAIDGGADARSIFGEKRVLERRMASFTTLEQLSAFLVGVFNRFVGYVFDFSQFQHANALRQVVGYIRIHYAERITLAAAAREVWLSPSYLSSVFSSEMGMSFTAYVQRVRIDKSKELLLGTHKTIAEVAAATGFADQSYFTKVFTKAVGLSPTQFRRQEVGAHG